MASQKTLMESFNNYFNLNLKPDKSLITKIQGLSNRVSPDGYSTSSSIPLDIETYNLLSELLGTPDQRIAKYTVFDHIDDRYPDASNALDCFADEIVTIDLDHQAPFWTVSENKQVVDCLDNLYYEVLKLKDGLYLQTIMRNLHKYGDNFNEIVVGDISGVSQLKELPVKSCWTKFDIQGTVEKYYQRFMNSAVASYQLEFEPWQIFHMKLPAKMTGSMYGQSLLNDAILPQRMLESIELAAMLSRINGATDRFVYKVPVGNRNRAETEAYLNEIKAGIRRKAAINTAGGQFVSVNDIMTSLEDLFIPVRESGTVEIERLDKRSSVSNSIEDIEYFDKKSKAALKMPFSYMENEQPLQMKSLSSGDLRFARRIMKGQAILKKFLYYIGELHLKYVWWDNQAPWTIQLSSVSQLEELAALENMEMRFNLAGTVLDHLPDIEIYTKILKYPEDKARELLGQLNKQRRERVVEDSVSARHAEIASSKLADQFNLPPEEALTQECRRLMMHNPRLRTAIQSLVEVNRELLAANKTAKK